MPTNNTSTDMPRDASGAPTFGPSTYQVQPNLSQLSWNDLGDYLHEGGNSALNKISGGLLGLNNQNSVTYGGFSSADFSFMFVGVILIIVGIFVAIFQTKTAQEIVVQPIVSTAKTAAKAAVAGAVI